MCADQTLCRHPRPDWEMRSWKPTIAVVGEGAKGLQCRQLRLAQLKRNDRWKIGKYIKKTKITFGCRCNSLISTQIRFFHHSASHIPSMSKSSGRHVCVQTQKCRLSSSAGVFIRPELKKENSSTSNSHHTCIERMWHVYDSCITQCTNGSAISHAYTCFAAFEISDRGGWWNFSLLGLSGSMREWSEST